VRPYLYLLPTFVFLFVFTHWQSCARSMLASSSGTWPVRPWSSLALQLRAGLERPRLLEVLRNNLLFAAGTVPLTLGSGTRAGGADQSEDPELAVYRVFLFYPTMIPMAAAAMIWLWILTPNYGLLNYYGRWFGLPDHPLARRQQAGHLGLVPRWGLEAVGYYMVIYLAGLQVIPSTSTRRPASKGRGPWQRFWKVTFPLVSPTTFFVAVMVVIDSFQAIDQVYLMTEADPGTRRTSSSSTSISTAFRFFDFGYASAISAILFLILWGLTVLAFRTLHRKVHYA